MRDGHLRLIEGGPPADEPRPVLPGYAAQMAEVRRRAGARPAGPRPVMDWAEAGRALEDVLERLLVKLGPDVGPEPLTPGAQVLALFAVRQASSPSRSA